MVHFTVNDTAPTKTYTLSLHDALPISHVEIVRYGAGQDAMGRLGTLLVEGGGGAWARRGRWLRQVLRRPFDFLRTLKPWGWADRKSTRLNSSHVEISYAVFCLKKKNKE